MICSIDTKRVAPYLALIAVVLLATADPAVGETSDSERGYLGFRYYYEVQTDGGGAFRVNGVLPEGPAGRAGLREGDLIVRVNAQSYRNDAWNPETDDPFSWLKPGDAVELEVLRDEAAEPFGLRVVAERIPDIGSLRRARGNVAVHERADAALDRLARDRALLEVDLEEQSIRRLDGSLDPTDRRAIEYLFFRASGMAGVFAGDGETDPRRLRLSLDEKTGRLRFDSVAAEPASEAEPDS